MLKETYYNPRYGGGWGIEPAKDDIVFFVMRNKGHILSPSQALYDAYKPKDKKKNKPISWNDYVTRFKQEMDNKACQDKMKEIKELSLTKDVWLVCSCFNKVNHCHRFLLMDMIEQMEP